MKSVALAREGVFFVSITSGGGRSAQTLWRARRGVKTAIERRRYRFPSQAGNIGPPTIVRGRLYFSVALPTGRVGARTVLVRQHLRSGRRSVAPAPARFRTGGMAGAWPSGGGFLLEGLPEASGPGLEQGFCNPDDRCELVRVTGLRWR